jgi:DNA polymerase-3 subunit chi
VIVNVSIQFPEHIEQAERILEIVDGTPEIKSEGRQRYRRYQHLGLTPVTHKV